jgi:hypothetical protein
MIIFTTICMILIITPYVLTFFLIRYANQNGFGGKNEGGWCLLIWFVSPITFWFLLCDNDVPNPPIINTLNDLLGTIFGIKKKS